MDAVDQRVGVLERADSMALTFTYAPDAPQTSPISLSLPVRPAPYLDADCRGYFENLLFEGPQLDRALDTYRLNRGDTGALLYHLGADCPGAISITPEGRGPGKRPGIFPDDYDRIDDERMLEIVQSLHLERRLPQAERDPSPLAGVQGKIALLYHDQRYYLPKPDSRAPTTHILKVSPARDPHLTEAETALLAIATSCGIHTTRFVPKTFKVRGLTIKAILLERFDRDVKGGHVRRIHTEDFCQALGLPPSLKYQRHAVLPEHQFSAKAVGTIAAKTSTPGLFVQTFLDHTLYNILVGNTDNHGKNGTILHGAGGTELAPLYDVVPVFTDTTVTHRLAFDIGTAHYVEDIQPADLVAMMRDIGFIRPRFDKRLEKKLRHLVSTISNEADARLAKGLADALAAQMGEVATALGLDLGVPERDYFPRVTRDESRAPGGWEQLS
ncbi:HipA domain-containing protein [Asticcacaulis sp. AC402]|uniref:HipA domain-containing protein n=1 Tax=Asticcacaulis sp. AC402 TaxID=1282361 RepID=UPI00190F4504|nr:HipA domain-containing protein [Asticcacaulis sp. AC402]